MLKLVKAASAFIACCCLTLNVFAAPRVDDTKYQSVSSSANGIQALGECSVTVSQNSRSFFALLTTTTAVQDMTSTVNVYYYSNGNMFNSDSYNTKNSRSAQAVYPVSYSGVSQKLMAKGYYWAVDNGYTIINKGNL